MLRLQKYLAQAGLGSRRSCEQLIKDKKILVNDNIAELGARSQNLMKFTMKEKKSA